MIAWLLAHRLILGLVGAGGLVAGVLALAFGWGPGLPPSGAVLVPPAPTRWLGDAGIIGPPVVNSPAPPVITATLTVYATGAVQRPGVYTLAAPARVSDLLAAAGGPTAAADLERINLAARLHDEEQVAFPRQGTPGPAVPAPPGSTQAPPGGPSAAPGPVNINTADQAALESLPGLGPVLAGTIIAYRTEHGPFARIEDIQKVSGIGPKIFARIRDHITVGP